MTTPLNAILFFGAPGTGKGTQGEILANVPGFYHLSTGDMFRGLDKASDLGKEFLKYSTQGLLVPDEFTVKLWQQHMADLQAKGTYNPDTQLLILDGIPRTLAQVELMRALVNVLAIIHLDCDDQEQLVTRLRKRAQKSGRPDDAKEDVVRKRLTVYRDETRPVLEAYDQALVHDVNAVGTPAEVLKAILAIVAPIQAKGFANALA